MKQNLCDNLSFDSKNICDLMQLHVIFYACWVKCVGYHKTKWG